MTLDLFRLQLLLTTFAGWVNRHQAQVIDYLVEENRVLKEQLRRKSVVAYTTCGSEPDLHADVGVVRAAIDAAEESKSPGSVVDVEL